MGPGRAARAAGAPPRSRGATPDLTAPRADAAPPPLWRDRWAWVCALAVIPIVVHSLGAPLGEPVAEDFDFLHDALFTRFTLFDGGGSNAFWRPLSHQAYYRTLSPLILHHPSLLAALHVLLLALASLLIYRAFRRAWPPAWAAVIATFPLLSESTRTLISWPSHFVDLGLWLFTAVLLHETAARRLWSALTALLAALLCKEVALVAAVLAPWLPGIGPRDRRERLRWAAALGALALLWGAAYWAVRLHAGLHLPHQLETSAATVGTPFPLRIAWAAGSSLRACFSLPAASSPWEWPVGVGAAVLVAIGLALTLVHRRRARADAHALALWGLAWFLGASATMAPIFPLWAPNRSLYGSLGVGALAAAFLGTAHSWLLGSLVALRLAAFAFSPAPPREIATLAPQNGAFLDFERLVRLQRLMRETRRTIGAAHPTLAPGAGVGLYNLPHDAEYAYGGSRSLQVWYRDTTLHWIRHTDVIARPDTPMVVIAEFEPRGKPQMALVPPEAMRLMFRAVDRINRSDLEGAFADLGRADSLSRDPAALMFAAQVAGNRAIVLVLVGRVDDAEREARLGITLWPANAYAHYALGIVEYRRGNLAGATAQAESVLRWMPGHTGARILVEAARAAARPGATANPGATPR